MFDQLNRQRKQKNWRILNFNFNQNQEQPQYNRSIIADNGKKYCPRKEVSQQKIFSKSKERYNLSKPENSDQNSFCFKGLVKQALGKRNATQQSETVNELSALHVNTERKINEKVPSSSRKLQQRPSLQVHQEYQTGPKLSPSRKNKTSRLSKFHFDDILNSSRPNISSQSFTWLQNQIKQNSQILLEVKQRFQQLKSFVLRELDEQREFLRQTVFRITDELQSMREKIRQEVYAEFEIKQKSQSNSVKQSFKNSTEFKLEDILKSKDSSFCQVQNVNLQHITNYGTFGKIQQSKMSQLENRLKNLKNQQYSLNNSQLQSNQSSRIVENISKIKMEENHYNLKENDQIQGNLDIKNIQQVEPISTTYKFGTETQIREATVNKQAPTRQLRTYKSTENLIKFPHSQSHPSNEHPLASRTNRTNEYLSEIQSMTSGRKYIPDSDQMQRFSEILKKQYEEKIKICSHLNKLDKQKNSEKIIHVQRFQGAMRKLKTDIMEFRNLSDTRDLKKIKFSSDQRPELNFLKEIGPNQLNLQQKTLEIGEVTKVI